LYLSNNDTFLIIVLSFSISLWQLIVIIGINILSLSILLSAPSITMANAQVSSDHREGSGADKQMGICVIGVSSPYNGDT
jgi:hypothetical protein